MDLDIESRNFSPAYIFAAFFVGYIGAWTALELLCRRTASRGFYNWFILLGSSLAMGGIAIWGMYFIGNRATVIGDGTEEHQLAYSPGNTTLSFFLPIFVLLIVFSVIGASDGPIDYVRIIFAGALAGLGVCAMYFLGQAGISNYDCIYTVSYVIGAVVIAITTSVVALGFFSYFRASWDTRWWSRVSCALILTTAVSGTHWVASVGTAYHHNSNDTPRTSSFIRSNNCIGVIVLSISGCVILLLITLLSQQHLAQKRNRDQQIAIAAVIFDEEGKVMVTPEGYLPHRRITNTYLEKTMDDVFGTSHSLFIWLFRTSYYWSSVTPLIPAMRAHLAKVGIKNRHGSHDEKMVSEQGEQIIDYALIFKELFCNAAAELADDFHLPLDDMGVLYDQILTTGWGHSETNNERLKLLDLEARGTITQNPGAGQLLFLTKSVDIREAYHLQAAGYRFAPSEKVVQNIAQNVQSNENIMLQTLERMRHFVTTDHTLERGVHLACFSIRPTMQPGAGGFEILARKDATNLLPTIQLPLDRLSPWQHQYLKDLDGRTVAQMLKTLRKTSAASTTSQRERVFAKQLWTRLEALKDEIEDPLFYDASFVGKPIEVPCRGLNFDSLPGVAIIMAFQIIVPLHSRAPGGKVNFVPVSFFKMQQFIQKNSPDHAEYSLKTYREFEPILDIEPDVASRIALTQTEKLDSNHSTPLVMTATGDRRTYVDDLFELCVARK